MDLLVRGASPYGACQQLGIPLERLSHTILRDPEFSVRLQHVLDLLGQNVVAALYQAAMKGSVSAQQFWLRERPPAHWTDASPAPSDPLWRLTDDELLDACREEGVDLPPDHATRRHAPPGDA